MIDFANLDPNEVRDPHAFMRAAVDRMCDRMRTTGPGQRNVTARAVSYHYGTLRHLANGSAESFDAEILGAVQATGLPNKEAADVFRRGVRDGQKEPSPLYVGDRRIETSPDDYAPRLRIRRSWVDEPPEDEPSSVAAYVEPGEPDPDAGRFLWAAARPAAGTPAEAYLKSRRIDLASAVCEVRHMRRAERHYAVFPIRDKAGEVVAIHRVTIDQFGEPYRFEDGTKRKITTGKARDGAFIAMDGEGPGIVCEGVEDAMSIAAAIVESGAPAVRVAAAVNSTLRLIEPGAVVFADRDALLPKVQERAREAGARVTTAPAPHKDAADLYACDGASAVMAALRAAEEPEEPRLEARGVSAADLANIRPRRWLYGRKLIRGFVTMIAAPGGVGKSALTTAMAMDMAAGRNTLHDAPHGRLKVWLYNLEDPRDETMRKVAAVYRYKRHAPEDLENIKINSGRDARLIMAEEGPGGSIIARPEAALLVGEIKAQGIDVLIVDPFVRAHTLDENNNKAVDFVMDLFAEVADAADCAVLLVHHTRKGFVGGDADSIRGGSAIIGAARVALTLAPMSKDEARDMNIPEGERRRLVRVDNAKANLAPPSGVAEWVKLESEGLDNGDDEYPDGDFVQVATPWEPPDAWAIIGPKLDEIISNIERGLVTEAGHRQPWSARPQERDNWVGNVFLAAFPDGQLSTEQIKMVLRTWEQNGCLDMNTEYVNETRHKRKSGVAIKSRPGVRYDT